MKSNFKNKLLLTAGSLLFLLLSGAVTSCLKDKSKEGLIPEKTFSAILSDVYLANGMLSMSAIRDAYARKDSINAYVDIVNSYGYSYEQMEKTLSYYFREDPKRLVRIYDRIDEKLSRIEMDVTMQQDNALATIAAKMKRNHIFNLPDPEFTGKPDFSFDIFPPGIFTLEFSVTLYPDDPSVNPSFVAWYSSAKGADSARCRYMLPVRYFRDGLPHVYSVKGHIEGKEKSVLKGFYLDYENNLAPSRLHADIVNLSFNYVGDNQ
jgi:hypothetical protein